MNFHRQYRVKCNKLTFPKNEVSINQCDVVYQNNKWFFFTNKFLWVQKVQKYLLELQFDCYDKCCGVGVSRLVMHYEVKV